MRPPTVHRVYPDGSVEVDGRLLGPDTAPPLIVELYPHFQTAKITYRGTHPGPVAGRLQQLASTVLATPGLTGRLALAAPGRDFLLLNLSTGHEWRHRTA